MSDTLRLTLAIVRREQRRTDAAAAKAARRIEALLQRERAQSRPVAITSSEAA